MPDRQPIGITPARINLKAYADYFQKHYQLFFLIIVSAASLFYKLSTGSLPPFDDTTYALVSKTILKTGDWITMRWLDLPYFIFGKPPLHFWLTALFYKLFGISEFTSRLPAAIHGVAGIVIVYFIGREIHSQIAGFIGALFLLSCPDYFRLSQSAMLDIPLTTYISLCVLFFLSAYRTRRLIFFCLFGASMGLAVMTKCAAGLMPLPIIVLFLLWMRNLKTILSKPFLMAALCGLLVALPWHLLQYLRYGRDFLQKYMWGTISYNFFAVLVSGQHSSPTFYLYHLYHNDKVHFLIFLASLPSLIAAALRGNYKSVFLVLYIVSVFGLFTLAETRMAWYLTPLFPALAVSSGVFLAGLYITPIAGRIISLVLIIMFIVQMNTLLGSDHWYLKGDPDLKAIILDFKSKTSEKDVLFSYGFGEALNTGPFYGDRKVIYITSNLQDEFEFHKKMGDYLNAGLIVFVRGDDDLVSWILSSRRQFFLLRAQTHHILKEKLNNPQIRILAANPSYVIIESL